MRVSDILEVVAAVAVAPEVVVVQVEEEVALVAHLITTTALDTGHDTSLHPLEVNGWDITGHDDLLAQHVEVIEDVEEGLLCLYLADESLYIVDNQEIHLLVEVNEGATSWTSV